MLQSHKDRSVYLLLFISYYLLQNASVSICSNQPGPLQSCQGNLLTNHGESHHPECQVAFPHYTHAEGVERCERSCTPGSLGTVVRTAGNLCRAKKGVRDSCREEVEVDTMASKMCLGWSKIFPFLNSTGKGKQVQHNPAKVRK